MNKKRVGNTYFCLAVGLSGVIYACFYALADRITLHIGLPGGAMGYVVSLYAAGSLCSTLLGGIFADRIGKLNIVCAALAAAALGCLLLGLAGLPAGVIAGVFLMGMGVSCNETQSSASLTERNPQNATRWLNISQILFCAGAIGAPVAAVWFGSQSAGGYRVVFWLLAALAAVASLAAFLLKGVTRDAPPAEKMGEGASLNMFGLLGRAPFFLTCLMVFLYVGYETVCVAFLKPYCVSRGLPDTLAAASISVFWAFMILGRFIGIFLGGRERASITAFGAVFLAGVALLLLGRTPPLLFIGAGLLGLGCGPVWPMLYVLGGRQHPQRNGAAFALMSLFSSGGGMVFPTLIGTWPGNYAVTMLLCGAACALLLALLVFQKRDA